MNSIELKNLQVPLKEKYKTDLESSMITLKSRGKSAREYPIVWTRAAQWLKQVYTRQPVVQVCRPAQETYCWKRWGVTFEMQYQASA